MSRIATKEYGDTGIQKQKLFYVSLFDKQSKDSLPSTFVIFSAVKPFVENLQFNIVYPITGQPRYRPRTNHEDMSGRGERGNRPPAGRGGGRFSGRTRKFQSNKKQEVKKKKSLSDYNYYLGSSSQASDYETTTDYIINYVKKTYSDGKDIADALTKLVHLDTNLWKPSLQVSLIAGTEPQDVARRDVENRQYEIEFKQELSRYSNRKQQYQENSLKAYALIRERCTEAMKIKIESRHDFESKILDNPIELLIAVKQHSLNYQEYRYNMSILSDSFKNLLTTKQKEGENLAAYAKRFKTASEILESHLGGELMLPLAVKQHPNYRDELSDEEKDKIASATHQQFLSFFTTRTSRSKEIWIIDDRAKHATFIGE